MQMESYLWPLVTASVSSRLIYISVFLTYLYCVCVCLFARAHEKVQAVGVGGGHSPLLRHLTAPIFIPRLQHIYVLYKIFLFKTFIYFYYADQYFACM